MQRASPKLAADLENRTTFLVQLRSLLTQAQNIVRRSQKCKLQDLQVGLEVWVREVGEVGTPHPSICAPTPGGSVAPSHDRDPLQSSSPDVTGGIDDSNKNTGSGRSPLTPPQLASVLTSVTAPPSARSLCGDALSSTVDMGNSASNKMLHGSVSASFALSSDFETRNLEDFAEFLGMFFSSGLQEIMKLRSVGRNAARLVIVRCFSIIACSLQQVLHQVYGEPREAEELLSKVNGEDNGVSSAYSFIPFSRDIRIATNAVMKCIELLTSPMDVLSMRFAAQVCVDVLKQLRQCVTFFVYRALCEEMRRLRMMRADASDPDDPSLDAAKLQQGAKRRAQELRLQMGPSLLASVEHLMSLVCSSVRYLMSVASRKDDVSSPEERGLKKDVCANVFALVQWVTPTSWLNRCRRQPLSGGIGGREQEPDVAAERSLRIGFPQSESFPDWDGMETTHLLCYRMACCVMDAVFPVAFSPEYIACVAEYCGDQNEGQLMAVRVLNDTVKNLMETDMEEFRHVLGCSAWRKRIAEGILNCLVSLEPAVLEAGLDTLQRIIVGCPECVGSEVGFVYTGGVFGLLESDSTPHRMRRLLLRHVISTFFTPMKDVEQPSLLLRLYQRFDLNVRWHQLNVVQQAIATLSKTVRCAAPEDFADEKETKSDNQEPIVPQKSPPFIALQGLSWAVELLSRHISRDGGGAGGKTYPRIENRDRKLEEQRAVDVFNSSPLKGIKKLFDVADDEMNPTGYKNVAEKNWAHQHIPLPASHATDTKVHRIAQFLMETPSLNPESVAEFLSSPVVLPLQVCRAFMETLPVAGKSLVDAMRILFTLVQLPKEGQRIERLLEFFCSAYFKANSVEGVDAEMFPFKTENACFIVGVAVIMLNTNLHNPHVASARMTDSSFYAQLKGCNEGKDFPEHFTKSIFHEVHLRSLSSMKGFWSAGMSSGVRYATVPFPGKMDSFFFLVKSAVNWHLMSCGSVSSARPVSWCTATVVVTSTWMRRRRCVGVASRRICFLAHGLRCAPSLVLLCMEPKCQRRP
ncbi:putative brefeldin A-inhibited guanine nucleotide-exchange protein 2 [Trypanosoma rangeli]|uniref:Putative brefeldin A-inhibited guanine nucleotide-exchange protein 2 n=1 Tax=Trypanosoma rangeli TaxID=5698 RepID=A0A3R7KJB6_TRYRA|nr:putative brefeldin A-inhibited guanine nucleotide-exchange protein 2 [Trypanosoma rangeli]RNF08691.1 putative brefeldin A-inhibited guanine nucleotide-exchange protein 2 [Trypanosoma rangeli]|eukprot:RNF08691.1 putative brefeldin A-inhibited guanine nucleotide-exchange protein 2 [Trypanosoma rangeli]